MRAFVAVFAREIFERRIVFPAALAAGFVPIIGSLAYGWSSADAAEGRVLVALVVAVALSLAFAILFGGSVIAGETNEKRISFYFSRPIPSGAIWAGKLLAAIAVAFAAAFLAFVPGWLSGSGRARNLWGFDASPASAGLAALALAVIFVLGSHAVVTVARLRSPWVALDLTLAPALVILALASLRSLGRDAWGGSWDASSPAEYAAIALGAVVFLALLFATLVQVAAGRTDARRAHGAFSVAFFGVTGVSVALVGGYAWWCASASATSLVTVVGGVQTAPRGPWLAAGGPLRAGRGSGSFLFDAVGGRSLRLHGWNAVFSEDGTHAAWGEPDFGFFESRSHRTSLMVADLASGRAVATGVATDGWPWLALSPTSRRLAALDGGTLSAYDVSDAANPKQLASFRIQRSTPRFAFVDEDTIRVFPRFLGAVGHNVAEADLEITELSLPSKKALVTGRFGRETLPYLRLTPDARFFVGTRRLTNDPYGKQALTLHDGRTGALVAMLADDLRSPQLRFLTGGRIVVAGIAGARAGLLFFERGETPPRALDLGPAGRIALGGEIAPGKVAVALLPSEENSPASRRAARLVSVDVASGAVSPLAEGLVPANRFGWWFNPTIPPAEAASPASLLFLDADGRLVRLDPATGERTVLLGRSK